MDRQKGIFMILATMKTTIAIPPTPMTISSIMGTMMLSSISGVQSFRPSKMYIIRANMMMP